jgi:hypothetical protein
MVIENSTPNLTPPLKNLATRKCQYFVAKADMNPTVIIMKRLG